MTEELNCSDGAKMLIERMQSNPEEFWGAASKWSTVMNQVWARRRGAMETHTMLTERDADDLAIAYDKYVREAKLAEHVIKNIMDPAPERKKVEIRTPGKSVMTTSQMRAAALQALEEQYEQAYSWKGDPFAEAPTLTYNTKNRYDIK